MNMIQIENCADRLNKQFQYEFELEGRTSAVYECENFEYQFLLTPEGVRVTVVDQDGLVVTRLCKRVYDWEKV